MSEVADSFGEGWKILNEELSFEITEAARSGDLGLEEVDAAVEEARSFVFRNSGLRLESRGGGVIGRKVACSSIDTRCGTAGEPGLDSVPGDG